MNIARGQTETDDAGLPAGHRRLAMLCVLTSSAMGILAVSLVTVALPSLARDLGVSAAVSVWIVNSYQLATAASILAFAGLATIAGVKRVFMGGLATFAIASLACALSGTLGSLIPLRFVQGLGAAAMFSVTPVLFRMIYPEQLLGHALGLNALVVATGMASGPVLGGLIVQHVSWVWLFAANVPLSLAALWLGSRVLPARQPVPSTFDAHGAVTSALVVCFLVGAASQMSRKEGMYVGAGLLVAALACLAVFARVELRARAPLLPPKLLRNRRLTLAACSSVVANIGQGMALVALPFLLQDGQGYSPGRTGLLLAAMPLAIMVAAPLSGRLPDRYGSTVLTSAGLLAVAIGLGSFALLEPATAGDRQFVWRIFLCGLGFGLFQTPNNREFIASVERALTPAGSGLLSFTRHLGLTLGAALMSVWMDLQAHGSAAGGAFGPLRASLVACAGVFFVSAAISALRFQRAPPSRNERQPDRFERRSHRNASRGA